MTTIPLPSFVAIPLIALLASAFLHLAALGLFPKVGLLDFPHRYGLTRKPIPYPAGIVTVLIFLLLFPTLFALPLSLQSGTLLIGIVALGAITFIDDRTPLPAWVRFGIQVLIALLLFLGGTRIYSLTNPLEQVTAIPLLSLDSLTLTVPYFGLIPIWSGVFTVVWLLLTINALNWFDGIPGQVSALSTIGFLTIGLLSLSSRVNDPALATVALTLAGLSLGALLFDFPPAKVLMGDTGAMFLGLMIGVLTIYSGGKVATAFLVLGVPLFDVFFVVLRRLRRGQAPWRGNATDQHLHHRLLKKGWSPQQVIALTAGLGTAFGVTALFLNTLEKFIAAILLFLVMMILSFYSKPNIGGARAGG